MEVVFAHDHIFYKYKDQHYSNGGLSGEMLKRYTRVFKKMKILTRQKKIDSLNNKLSFSSIADTVFIEVPNFKSIKTYHNKLKAKKIVEREILSSDCVIARLPSSVGYLAIKFAIKHSKPYAVEIVGCPWDALWNYGNIQGKMLAPGAFLITKQLVKSSKYTLYVTKNFLQKRYPSKGMTTNSSNVQIPDNSEKILMKRIDKINKANQDQVIKIGMIGSLGSKYKGFDLAIEAIDLLSNYYQNIELHILGLGDKSRWERLVQEKGVEDKVFFDGALPSGEAVYGWIDKLDIYIQPSKSEGLPRALIEAMSRGCPIVGSNVGGIPELLGAEFLHNKKNSEDLASKIEKLILNNDLKIEQAKKNFYNSKDYTKVILDKRRDEFWQEFRNFVYDQVKNQ